MLEREELRIRIGFSRHNGKNTSVALRRKLQNLSRPNPVDIGYEEIAASVKRQTSWISKFCCERGFSLLAE